MKNLLLFIVLLLPLLAEAQPAPVFEASSAQTAAETVGAPFYISPRRLGEMTFVATNIPLGTFTNVLNTYSNSVATNIIAIWPTTTNLVLWSGSNGPPVVGNTAIIVGTNANGSTVIKGTNAQSAINSSSNSIVGLFGPSSTNFVVFSGSNGPPVVGQAFVIVGTNSFGAVVVQSTNWPTGGGGGGGIVLPPNALGVLTNDSNGNTNWSTSLPGTWIGAGTLPRTAADSTWASATNYLSLTNRAANTMVLGQTPKTTGGTNGFGSPTISLTNLLMGDLEYHISTNAFTNVVVGYIGPLTNYDGFRFYIPVGTNFP